MAILAGAEYWRFRISLPLNLEFYLSAPEKATLNTMGVAGAPAISPDGKQILHPASQIAQVQLGVAPF
jgi:hypothetical protein